MQRLNVEQHFMVLGSYISDDLGFYKLKGILLEVLHNPRLIHTTSGIVCFTIRLKMLYYKTVIILLRMGFVEHLLDPSKCLCL